jgi:hypothetical protein
MVRTLKPNELKTYLADFDIEFYEETQGTADDRGSGMPHRPHARLEEVLRSERVGHQHSAARLTSRPDGVILLPKSDGVVEP